MNFTQNELEQVERDWRKCQAHFVGMPEYCVCPDKATAQDVILGLIGDITDLKIRLHLLTGELA